MENKFQIGDLVEVIGVESDWEDGVGKVGTVCHVTDWVDSFLYAVEFPERYNTRFHKCDGAVSSGNGWNIMEDNLCLVESVSDVVLDALL